MEYKAQRRALRKMADLHWDLAKKSLNCMAACKELDINSRWHFNEYSRRHTVHIDAYSDYTRRYYDLLKAQIKGVSELLRHQERVQFQNALLIASPMTRSEAEKALFNNK